MNAETQKTDVYKFDGLDDAIVGIGSQAFSSPRLVYSYDKLVSKFMADGMTEEEAEEYIDFNIVGVNIGDETPIIMHEMTGEEAFSMFGSF
jgi:hypothetical protein